ncbi:MAG: TIGR03663 family protein, partial [Verrucomicrobiota bacterium]
HLSESDLRAVSVFFGVALILLLWLMADGLGSTGTVCAAIFTAISPAMVFYSRYFIHEMLLVCFTLLVILAGWRYAQRPSASWAIVAGLGLGLMYATKETFVLSVAALLGALAFTLAWRVRVTRTPFRWHWGIPVNHLLLAAAAAALISLLLFTSFFTNARGPFDSVRTYFPWLKRAGGDSPHIHPWSFYFERLVFFKTGKGPVWSEALLLVLALIGAVTGWRGLAPGAVSPHLTRFLTVYTVLLAAAYSAIAYKTPWCLLTFLQPLILLAGIGAAFLIGSWKSWGWRLIGSSAVLVGAAHLTWEAWRASFPFAADRRNPYVYAQTVPDLLRLVEQVHELAKFHPDGTHMVIKVMAQDSDYWPLPWSLRAFDRIGWWSRVPADPYAPVVIAGAKLGAALDDRSEKKWLMVGLFELRPQTFLELYVQDGLWEKYILSRPRPEE